MFKRFFPLILLSLILSPYAAFAQTDTTTASSTVVPVVDSETLKQTDGGDTSKSTSLDGTYERAIVTDVHTKTVEHPNGAQQLEVFVVQFLGGEFDGKTREISSELNANPYNLEPRAGDKVLIYVQPNPSGAEPLVFLEGYDRRIPVYTLIVLFVLTLVLLSGWQGLKVAFSILLSILLIGFVLIPSFLKGLNPVPIAFLLSGLFAAISSVLTMGWNRKSAVTVIGTVGGAFVAYLICVLFSNWAHLGGLSSEEDRLFFDKNPTLNPQGLLFAGIIIASMGVVEDVAVSIASAVAEIRQSNTRLDFKQLFRSGMVVGRDHMGALANTLVFAYVGASLSTLLLFSQYGGSWAKFINFDSIVDEIIRSLAGTIGLVFTVPITALLAAWFTTSLRHSKNPIREVAGWRPHDSQAHSHTSEQE
jgi:uncharacterized membrane protein